MKRIVIELSRQRKRFVCRWAAKQNEWRFKRNVLIVLPLSEGKHIEQVAAIFRVHRSTLWRIAKRFLRGGLGGLSRLSNGSLTHVA